MGWIIMAVSFYNFWMHVIRSINKYFTSKMSLQDCLQMSSSHHYILSSGRPAALWEAVLTKRVQKDLGLFSIYYTYILLRTNTQYINLYYTFHYQNEEIS